jgi:predicted membrane protein
MPGRLDWPQRRTLRDSAGRLGHTINDGVDDGLVIVVRYVSFFMPRFFYFIFLLFLSFLSIVCSYLTCSNFKFQRKKKAEMRRLNLKFIQIQKELKVDKCSTLPPQFYFIFFFAFSLRNTRRWLPPNWSFVQ